MLKRRVFIDSNTVLSGVLFEGPESVLLKSPLFCLLTSHICEGEVEEVVERKFAKLGKAKLELAKRDLKRLFARIDVVGSKRFDTKQADIAILEDALAAEPDFFVTGDKKLLHLAKKSGLRAMTTRKLLELLNI